MNHSPPPAPVTWPARIDELRARWPQLVDRVSARLLAGGPVEPIPPACRHLLTGAQPAVACLYHVAGGLRCVDCHDRHVEEHDQDEERRCDECAQESRWLHKLTVPSVAPPHVRGLDGRRRQLAAEMVIAFGAAMCPRCWRAGQGGRDG